MPENSMDMAAGEDLAPPANDNESAETDGGRDDTFFLPKEALDGQEAKAGDILKFKVVGMDSEGGVEVECVHDKADGAMDGEGDWKDALRKSVKSEGGSTQQSY